MEYELKVEVDETFKEKFPKNVFYIKDKLYLYFRIKDKIMDEGNVFLFITFPEFPILEVDNRTKEEIKIYETKKEDQPMIINPLSKIPFTWNNNVVLKNKFVCEILNHKIVLSFSEYKDTYMKISDNNYIYISIFQKNSLTGTRCITFEKKARILNVKRKVDKKNIFELIFIPNKSKSLNRFNIFIKGIGLSFLDEVPREIFYISLYEIRFIYTNLFISSLNTTTEDYEFYIKNFQIDSSLNNTIKTLIYPKNQNIPSLESENSGQNESVDFISLAIAKQSNVNIAKEMKNVKYPKIDLCMQEMNVKIDQVIIMNLINLIQSYTSKLDYLQASPENKNDNFEDEERLKKEI